MPWFNRSLISSLSCIQSQSAGGPISGDGGCKEPRMVFFFAHKKELRNNEYEVLLIDERNVSYDWVNGVRSQDKCLL